MEINDVSKLLEEERKEYMKRKITEYEDKGFTRAEAINKANQSWRTYIGARIQDVIFKLLEKGLRNTNLKLTTDKTLSGKNLPAELDMVKRKLAINYGEYLFLPEPSQRYSLHKLYSNITKLVTIRKPIFFKGKIWRKIK